MKETIVGTRLGGTSTAGLHQNQGLDRDRTTIFGRIGLSTTVLEKYEIGKIISITLCYTFRPHSIRSAPISAVPRSQWSFTGQGESTVSLSGLGYFFILCFFDYNFDYT